MGNGVFVFRSREMSFTSGDESGIIYYYVLYEFICRELVIFYSGSIFQWDRSVASFLITNLWRLYYTRQSIFLRCLNIVGLIARI